MWYCFCYLLCYILHIDTGRHFLCKMVLALELLTCFIIVILLLLSTHFSLLIGGSPFLLPYEGLPTVSPANHLAGLLRGRDPSTNPGPTASVGNSRDVVWYVRGCDKGGRVVMGVLRRRFCVDMIGGKGIYLFLVGLGYDACAGVSSLQSC